MPRRGKEGSRKRARRRHWLDEETSENLPRYIPVDLDRLSKETADTTKKWVEWLKATEAPPPPRAAINRPFGRPAAPKPKRKRKAKRGAPVEFDTDGGIAAAASDVAGRGVDDTQSEFINRVHRELEDRHIKAPGLTWMKKHVGPIYKRAKRKAHSGR